MGQIKYIQQCTFVVIWFCRVDKLFYKFFTITQQFLSEPELLSRTCWKWTLAMYSLNLQSTFHALAYTYWLQLQLSSTTSCLSSNSRLQRCFCTIFPPLTEDSFNFPHFQLLWCIRVFSVFLIFAYWVKFETILPMKYFNVINFIYLYSLFPHCMLSSRWNINTVFYLPVFFTSPFFQIFFLYPLNFPYLSRFFHDFLCCYLQSFPMLDSDVFYNTNFYIYLKYL